MEILERIAEIEPVRLALYAALLVALFYALERFKFAQSVIRNLFNMEAPK